ncbi:BTAD domain-containing putative transcriptional regulator [Phytohabitans suffuscus]
MVEFRALGPVEAMVADRLVDLGAPKQRALLALLVSRVGQPVAVEAMLEALWAGNPPPSAMASLQAYVANLRRVLEPSRAPRTPATVLRTSPRGYLLDRRVVDVDVHRFGEHATAGWQAWDRGDPRQALAEFDAGLALWRGQAYAEVATATYVVPEVARLEELQLSVVEARCAALLAVGAHEAVAELEAFIQAHPLREYGCELLSLALYRAGRQAEALGVLRTIQKRLAEELGIDPRPSLQHLEREILNQAPALDWRPATGGQSLTVAGGPVRAPQPHASDPPPAPVAAGEAFVGRGGALRQLGEALAGAAGGRGRVVAVSGEPGIGKTSLLRRFAGQAGVPVLWGTCPEHVDAPPLWLWEQVLRAAGARFPQRRVPAPVAELLDSEAQPAADGTDMAGATLRRFEAIVHYLTEAAQAGPLVVVLDHLHRADASSLRLLAHLAESVPASRLLLAVAYRSGEAAPLSEALAALARTGMTRLELDGLNAQETQALARAILRRDVTMSAAEALWARTDGNPFFLRELIRSSSGGQRQDQPHTVPVPVPVREVVLRRVARLPQAAAEVLAVAAIAGRHFDIAVVAGAASVEIEAALEALDAAVAAGLIVEDPRRLGWFRFAHALTAEALYETTGRLRRARLHRRIGAAAARAWAGTPERAAEIARHWLLAAELDPSAAAQASTHAAAAARVADARLAFDEAAALWRQALAAADLAERADLDRYPLLTGLGTSLYRAGDTRAGLSAFVQVMEEILGVRGEPDTSRLVTAAVTALSELSWYPVDRDEVDDRLVDVLERALVRVTDPVRRALVLSCLAVARYHDGDPVRRAELSDEALALVRHAPDDAALLHVLHLRAVALDGPDHHDERLQAATEMLALPGLPPSMAVRARQFRAQVLVAVGSVPEAAAELDLAARLADEECSTVDRHSPTKWGSARFNRVFQRWEAAYLDGAGAGLADELRAVTESSGLPALQGILATALGEAGQVHDARVALRRLPHRAKDHLWLYTNCWALLAAARLGETALAARLRDQLLPYRHLTCSALDLAIISGPVAYFTAEAALALDDPAAALADLEIAADLARRMGAQPWLDRVREVAVLEPGVLI